MTEQFSNGYALLIGVDENYVEKWALPDVKKDITALSKVLIHTERCAYPADNVKVIAGQAATRQGILEGLEWLQACLKADTSCNATTVIYYSGHGWRDDAGASSEFYLIPYDMRENQIRSRALRTVDFGGAVAELKPQRLLVVLDCCHAGGMAIKDVLSLPAGYVGTAIPARLWMEAEVVFPGAEAKGLEMLGQGAGRAVLSSSKGEQLSYLRRDGTMSIFTYHLLEALTGHAQPQEGASEVLVSDVMSYVWRHVPRSARVDWGVEQEPDYQVTGNFPVALLLGGKGLSKSQLPPDPLESVASEDAASVIRGDEITVGNISGSTGVAIGRGAQASVTQGNDVPE
jgi:uncharacterized caspase-like protein